MPKPDAFGAILRRERERAGLSVAALAAKAKLVAATIRMYEAGTRYPGWEAVQLLAKALGLPTDAFCDRK